MYQTQTHLSVLGIYKSICFIWDNKSSGYSMKSVHSVPKRFHLWMQKRWTHVSSKHPSKTLIKPWRKWPYSDSIHHHHYHRRRGTVLPPLTCCRFYFSKEIQSCTAIYCIIQAIGWDDAHRRCDIVYIRAVGDEWLRADKVSETGFFHIPSRWVFTGWNWMKHTTAADGGNANERVELSEMD